MATNELCMMTTESTGMALREENKTLNWAERAAGKEILSSYPLVAKIEVTNRCNLACTMCAMSYDRTTARTDLSMDNFSKLEPIFPYLLSA